MKAIKEYNRLRLLYTSHLGELLPLADDSAVDSTGMQNKPHTSRKRKKPNIFAKPNMNNKTSKLPVEKFQSRTCSYSAKSTV